MSSNVLQITVTGKDEVLGRLEAIVSQKFVDDILDESVAIVLGRIRANFLSKVDPDGLPWIPSHAGQLREAKGGSGTGYDSGKLFHSLQEFEAGPNQRAIGTDVTSASGFPYGKVFQDGRSISSKKGGSTLQPERVFLGFGPDDQVLMDALVQSRIDRVLGNG